MGLFEVFTFDKWMPTWLERAHERTAEKAGFIEAIPAQPSADRPYPRAYRPEAPHVIAEVVGETYASRELGKEYACLVIWTDGVLEEAHQFMVRNNGSVERGPSTTKPVTRG